MGIDPTGEEVGFEACPHDVSPRHGRRSIRYQERSTYIEEPGNHQHDTHPSERLATSETIMYTIIHTYKGAHTMHKKNIIGTIIRIITNIAVAMTLVILSMASFNGSLQNVKEWIGDMNTIILLIVEIILAWRLGNAASTFMIRLFLYTFIRKNKVQIEQQGTLSENEEEAASFKKFLDKYSQEGSASVLRSLCEATANGILLFFLLLLP